MGRMVLGLLLTFAPAAWADDGVVCVSRLRPPRSEPVMNPDPSKAATRYLIRIDDSAWQSVDATQAPRFEQLSRKVSHLVRIAIDRRVIESFRFRFEEKGNSRLQLHEGYFTWTLAPDACHRD